MYSTFHVKSIFWMKICEKCIKWTENTSFLREKGHIFGKTEKNRKSRIFWLKKTETEILKTETESETLIMISRIFCFFI